MSVLITPAAELDRPYLFIGGEWVTPTGEESLALYEAATEQPLGTVAVAGASDVDAAVGAARAALDGPWGAASPAERAEHLLRMADALERRVNDTAALVSRENGTITSLSRAANGVGAVGVLRRMAEIARTTSFSSVRPSSMGSTIVNREPIGVVGAFATWNYPQLMAVGKFAPALAAGCTVVLRPAPETALDAYILGDAAVEAGLPPGVLNIVVGDADTGRAIVAHPDVDKISFTGSTAVGRQIGEVAGRMFKRLTLELGGKSAAIVLPDADINAFADTLSTAVFKNGGQTCTTNGRILAHRDRYDEVVEALVSYATGLKAGDPLDESVTLGPMATSRHRDRVLDYIAVGQREGARLLTGGTDRPAGLERGWFVRPTVFGEVDNRSRLGREEVFGPVIAVTPFDTEDEAIELANDSDYGLGGAVFTADEDHGIDVAGRIRTGTIGVNYYQFDTGAPFGGVKSSGIGREYGPEAIDAFLEYKSIYASANRLN